MYQVAVLDDSEIWCLILKTMLTQSGFRVTTFTRIAEFLNAAEQFDLALVDFSIPARSFQQQLDGCEVTAQLKQRLATPPLVILMSAFFTCEFLQTAQELCPCADAYLSKDSMRACLENAPLADYADANQAKLMVEVARSEPLVTTIETLLARR